MDRSDCQTLRLLIADLFHILPQIDGALHGPARVAEARRRLEQLVDASRTVGEPRLSPIQLAAVNELAYVLQQCGDASVDWDRYRSWIETSAAELVQVAAGHPTLLHVQRAEHGWNNAATAYREVQNVEDCLQSMRQLLERFTVVASRLPGIAELRAALKEPDSKLAGQRVLEAVDCHRASIRRLDGWLAERLRVMGHATRIGAARPAGIRTILVVEDEPSWSSQVESLARQVAIASLEDLMIETAPDCESALRRIEQEEQTRSILIISDVGLPQRAGEVASPSNGRRLIQELRARGCCTLVLTTLSYFHADCCELGHCASDFVLKAPGWQHDLASRLTSLLQPMTFHETPLLIPVFDPGSVRLGSVWVPLKTRAFAILDACALAFPESPTAVFDLLPDYSADSDSSPGPARYAKPLTLDQLKLVMCRREVSDLPANFMEEFGEKQLLDQLRELRGCLEEAFADHEIPIDSSSLIGYDRRTRTVHLHAPVRICNTPEEFRRCCRLSDTEAMFRVLVVEDDPEWRARLEAALFGLAGSQVRTAGNYDDAMDIVRVFQPHFISLDLQIPGPGGSPADTANGLRLRSDAARLLGSVRIVTLTSRNTQTLYNQLARAAPPDEVLVPERSADELRFASHVTPRRSVIRKDSTADQQLRIEVWRAQQEIFSEGLLPSPEPYGLHNVVVELDDPCVLWVNGRRVENTARRQGRRLDDVLLRTLACYRRPLRKQAILDQWARCGLLDDVRDPGDRLRKRVQHLRSTISLQAGVRGEEVLQNIDDGYALRGNVDVRQPSRAVS